MGRLEIRVCGARNVANLQTFGKPDPYVKVKMSDKKANQHSYKTRVIENSLNPVWNEMFKFQVADYDTTQMLLELWNDNVLVDDLLGTYSLSLNGLTRGVVVDTWAILSGTKRSSTELHLRILAVDFGKDPSPHDRVVTSLEQDNMAAPTHQSYRPAKPSTPMPGMFGPAPALVYGPPPPPGFAVPPPQPMYGAPPPPPFQPMYGAPPPPPPPPQPMYGCPPPPRAQMAFGIPPDL